MNHPIEVDHEIVQMEGSGAIEGLRREERGEAGRAVVGRVRHEACLNPAGVERIELPPERRRGGWCAVAGLTIAM